MRVIQLSFFLCVSHHVISHRCEDSKINQIRKLKGDVSIEANKFQERSGSKSQCSKEVIRKSHSRFLFKVSNSRDALRPQYKIPSEKENKMRNDELVEQNKCLEKEILQTEAYIMKFFKEMNNDMNICEKMHQDLSSDSKILSGRKKS